MGAITTLDNSLYERDFQAWLLEQASLLRAGRLVDLDMQNIAEELEGMGRNQRHKIESHLVRILHHLLKLQFQSGRRTRSWSLSIAESRQRIAQIVRDSPSLRSLPSDILGEAYAKGRHNASLETGIPLADLPETCPYKISDVLDETFLPNSAHHV